MATTATFRIDQIVHGYSRGHRELARSIDLDDRARSTMMLMSDLLIARAPAGEGSYLTCYPLPSASRHVLARTWSAGSDYRPGSVWTHSLLIDYPSLAQLHDLAGLSELLRLPTEKLQGFDKPLSYRPSTDLSLSVFDDRAARIAIAGIYGGGERSSVDIPATLDVLNEALALALWRQAWPGLRRDFGFVSGLSDRPIPIEAGCSLTFVREFDQDRELDLGGHALLRDLPEPGPTSLRTFMSRYVIEASEPRNVAQKVAMIFALNEGADDIEVTSLAKLAKAQGLPRLKRDLIAAELQSAVGPNALINLVDEFWDEPVASLPSLINECLAKMSKEQLRTLVRKGLSAAEGTLGRLIVREVLASTDVHDLAEIADCSNRRMFLEGRPELATFLSFWPSLDDERAELLESVLGHIEFPVKKLVATFNHALGSRTAGVLVTYLVREEPAAILALLGHENPVMHRAAMARLGCDPHLTSQAIAELSQGQFDDLEHIAQAVLISQSKLGSAEEWVEGINRVRGNQRHAFGPYSSILVLIVAFRIGGSVGLDLAADTFESVLNEVRQYALARERESWLNLELPSGARWRSTASRIHAAAVGIWPVRLADAGALILCERAENVRDILDEVILKQGKHVLQGALLDLRLPRAAQERIKEKIAPPKRSGLFGF